MMIKFGTDGWRGVLADTFTFDNVRAVTQALADLIKGDKDMPDKLAIGYDRRFLSVDFAREAASIMASNGIEVLFARDYLPTPVISWAAKNISGLAGAIVITASHNPFYYNGFKFKERQGCSAFPETTKKIEDRISRNMKDKRPVESGIDFKSGIQSGKISFFNPIEDYSNWVTKFVDADILRKFKNKILVDPMNGSGSGYLAKMIRSFGVEVGEIHSGRDALFGGSNPEPIEIYLKDTIEHCRKEKPSLAIVLDGDSDRIGAIDERGNFFNSQQVYSLLAWHFLANKAETSPLGKTVSTTHIIDRLGKKYGNKIYEVPIGFKHLAKMMIEGSIFLGGEESGGIGLAAHLPERDPILVSLILLEMLAHQGSGPAELYERICSLVGPAYFYRRDFEISDKQKDNINASFKLNPPDNIAGKKVRSFSDKDGYKFIFDDSWLLIRTSGTEAVLRLYAEAATMQESKNLIEKAQKSLSI